VLFNRRWSGDDVVVACTQERRLFTELAGQTEGATGRPIRFVNIRETGGWSKDARRPHPRSPPCWRRPICQPGAGGYG
jgi:hypothetical protein